jgi:hypothetical protein
VIGWISGWPSSIRPGCGCPADSAFELLKWRSQETNTKLRVLAEQIVKDFLQLSYDEAMPARAVYDRLLLTAHTRVGS